MFGYALCCVVSVFACFRVFGFVRVLLSLVIACACLQVCFVYYVGCVLLFVWVVIGLCVSFAFVLYLVFWCFCLVVYLWVFHGFVVALGCVFVLVWWLFAGCSCLWCLWFAAYDLVG